MRLGLAEEIVLLGLDDETGRSISYNMSYAVSGAILADLRERGRIAVADHGHVEVADETPTGDDILDEAIRTMRSAKKADLLHWVRTPLAEHQRERILDRLVNAGILDRVRKHALGIFPYQRYPAHDGAVEDEIRARIRAAALGGSSDGRTIALMSLADACDLLRHVIPKDDQTAAGPVVQKLTASEPVGAAVREAIRDDEAAILLTGAAN